ncbi:16S rRNA (uracil(1498)-N(3))-methyltransferase [Marinobacter salicampi]|uniref:16S rRNA (uracil(1498)-N(3))-methyltransferase n=1 Tax=Marinobacter salicampi TaxID=435907 RepID=UPI00140DEE8A|nr:16S rRNA (uracil(1498)-N(3))-methyltransferase [Marinobacter salicampi]
MNLALLFPEDFITPDRVRLTGRRRTHLAEVRKACAGDRVPVGMADGDLGWGSIVAQDEDTVELAVDFSEPAPAPLPLTLVLAMPRPKMFRRVLQTAASLGVKDIWLINSYKVEKSFWQTPLLAGPQLRENLILGLEQARDTAMPRVHIRKLFKPFVEDELPSLTEQRPGLVAHPGSDEPCPVHLSRPATLCIGPEGGFIPYEVEKLIEAGCRGVHLGKRILRVETAVPVLVSRLFDGCIR